MSDSDNKPFNEDDSQKTIFTYGVGGIPFYIYLAWAGMLITYVTYLTLFSVPDLKAWLTGF